MHYPTQTLVDVAYKALKKDIAEGVLVPGQKLIMKKRGGVVIVNVSSVAAL